MRQCDYFRHIGAFARIAPSAACLTAATGLMDGQPKRDLWVPTDAFLPCMRQVSQIVAPWIVAGQGKGEFPEAFNQIGMHTDVV